MTADTRWLTVKEAALEVGVSQEAVRQRLRSHPDMERMIEDGMVVILSDAIAAWVSERAARAAKFEARYQP